MKKKAENPANCVSQPETANHTIAFWQKKANRPLNTDDAREIVENVTGFFGVLAEWAERDRQSVTGQYSPQSA